jgi:hypothetical protein
MMPSCNACRRRCTSVAALMWVTMSAVTSGVFKIIAVCAVLFVWLHAVVVDRLVDGIAYVEPPSLGPVVGRLRLLFTLAWSMCAALLLACNTVSPELFPAFVNPCVGSSGFTMFAAMCTNTFGLVQLALLVAARAFEYAAYSPTFLYVLILAMLGNRLGWV